jgi:hypothetical protein
MSEKSNLLEKWKDEHVSPVFLFAPMCILLLTFLKEDPEMVFFATISTIAICTYSFICSNKFSINEEFISFANKKVSIKEIKAIHFANHNLSIKFTTIDKKVISLPFLAHLFLPLQMILNHIIRENPQVKFDEKTYSNFKNKNNQYLRRVQKIYYFTWGKKPLMNIFFIMTNLGVCLYLFVSSYSKESFIPPFRSLTLISQRTLQYSLCLMLLYLLLYVEKRKTNLKNNFDFHIILSTCFITISLTLKNVSSYYVQKIKLNDRNYVVIDQRYQRCQDCYKGLKPDNYVAIKNRKGGITLAKITAMSGGKALINKKENGRILTSLENVTVPKNMIAVKIYPKLDKHYLIHDKQILGKAAIKELKK